MENALATTCAEGLTFFSKTNRLISHELKNILAIISETLGLMEELTALAKSGKDLAPGKLESLSTSIIEEVERANQLTRGMNTFAHTVDELTSEVDVRQAVESIMQLAHLDADIKNTGVRLAPGDACRAHTSAFFLQNLIYRILKQAPAGEDRPAGAGPIEIAIAEGDDAVQIIFSNTMMRTASPFPTERQAFLAKMLSAHINKDKSADVLTITLPKKPGDSMIDRIVSSLADNLQ